MTLVLFYVFIFCDIKRLRKSQTLNYSLFDNRKQQIIFFFKQEFELGTNATIELYPRTRRDSTSTLLDDQLNK